jgi:hypothetical protein
MCTLIKLGLHCDDYVVFGRGFKSLSHRKYLSLMSLVVEHT